MELLPHSQLLIFAKYPRAGQVKTRLSPPLAADDAARLYRAFLLDALDLYGSLAPAITPVLLLADAGDIGPMRALLDEEGIGAGGLIVRAQQGAKLGDRLRNAFGEAFAAGARSACAIGTDHPTLPVEYIGDAFDALAEYDIAVGPADDGGYYLLAMRARHDALFESMPYSTPDLFVATLRKATGDGLRALSLSVWYDVDDGESLQRLRADRHLLPAGGRTLRALDALDRAADRAGRFEAGVE